MVVGVACPIILSICYLYGTHVGPSKKVPEENCLSLSPSTTGEGHGERPAAPGTICRTASVEPRIFVRDWTNVVFTDESSFWPRVPGSKALFNRTNCAIERTVKHAVKVHVWGCFNVRGLGTLCVFTAHLNAQEDDLNSGRSGGGGHGRSIRTTNEQKVRSRTTTAAQDEYPQGILRN
ncbi:hypothetical protein Trydic_g126 [Trypoxylus dichotomus]